MKTLVLYYSHAGWPGHTLGDLKQGLGGAAVTLEKDFRFDAEGAGRLQTLAAELEQWLDALEALTR